MNLDDISCAQAPHPDNITWEQYWKYLLVERKVKDTVKNRTAYLSRFKALQKAFHGKEWNRDTVTSYFYNLQTNGAKESHMNKFITILDKHFDKILKTEVMKDFTRYVAIYDDPFAMSIDEISRLLNVKLPYSRLAVERQNRDFVVMHFLFATSCRPDELQKLEWKDIISSPSPKVVFRDTKSRKNRKVTITQWMYDQLLALPRYSDRVFDSPTGKQFNTQEFNKNLKEMAKLANLPLETQKKLAMKYFRSSRATYLTPFVDPFLLAKILGHESTEVTMKYYQPNEEQMNNAAYNNPLQVQYAKTVSMVNVVKEHLTKLFNPQNYAVNIASVGEKGGFTLEVMPI